METAKKPPTVEEYARNYSQGQREGEVVDSQVVRHMPPSARHGFLVAKLLSRLQRWAEQGNHGIVGARSGFVLQRNPDRVRGPDVWFVQRDSAKTGIPDGYWQVAPHFAIEVISPNDTVEVVKERLEDYMKAGIKLMWLVYPRFKQVESYTADGTMRIFRDGDTLEAGQLLPGFTYKISELFEG